MIKILSTGKNYPHITFSGTRVKVATGTYEYHITQEGSGDYVSNFNEETHIPASTSSFNTELTVINETNYEMKLHDEMYGATYTLAPGNRKTFFNGDTREVSLIVTYTSPNPPPQSVDVQAIVMG